MENNNVHIDYEAIVKDISERAMITMVASFMPDENSKKFCVGIMNVHRKHGIDLVTSMKILQELGEILKEENMI
jgi:hypothetical protein